MFKTGEIRHPSHRLKLTRLWLSGHIMFVFILLLSLFVKTPVQGISLLALAGIPWAMTQWIPHVALNEQVFSMSVTGEWEPNSESEAKIQTGTIMSLHNAAISLPQILAAVVCSGIFWVWKGLGWSDATAWSMRMAAFGTLIAAYLTFGFSRRQRPQTVFEPGPLAS